MTQLELLRQSLKNSKMITNDIAYKSLTIRRLSERIRELEKSGYKFRKYYTGQNRVYVYEVMKFPKKKK